MTGDALYALTVDIACASRTPWEAHLRTKLMLRIHLMEKVDQPVQWKWRGA